MENGQLVLLLGVLGFCLSLAFTPAVRNFAHRFGMVDHPDNHRKIHATPIPRVGGVAIAFAYFLACLVLLIGPGAGPVEATSQIWRLAPAIAVVILVGLYDDLRGLKPWQKLAGQVVAASLAFWAGVRVFGVQGHETGSLLISFALTVGWLLVCTNALNLIDGLDGLATGIGLFATMTTLLAALTHGNVALVLLTMPLVGALLGFLRYNFNPASIFLGDSGSLFIGFLLGCYGVLWSQKSATLLGMTAPLMAMAIPLLDVALAVLRRFLRRQPIFSADRGHIHHRLLDRGLTPRRVALLMYAVCGIGASLSLLQDAASNEFRGIIIVVFCAGAWVGVQHLGYVEFGVAGRIFFGFRRIIDGEIRLQQFEEALQSSRTMSEYWERLLSSCRSFGFHDLRLKVGNWVFEGLAERCDHELTWQVRIPLGQGEYLNFRRDFAHELHPLVVAGFVRTVEAVTTEKLHAFRKELNDSVPMRKFVARQALEPAVAGEESRRSAGATAHF